MNRLTPEIVSDAFARTGMEPFQLAYRDNPPDGPPGRCCGLFAVASARQERRPRVGFILRELADLAGVSEEYAKGFTWGWDCPAEDSHRRWSAETRQGFLDGRASWLAVGEGKEARNG